jgi:hypothetical protein
MAVTRPNRAERERRARRNARLLGLAGFLGAAALPIVLWHRAIVLIVSDFRLEAGYVVGGMLGYALIVVGLLFFIPVLLSLGRRPGDRLYPYARNAYLGWGVSMYLLGLALAVQVAAIAHGVAEH